MADQHEGLTVIVPTYNVEKYLEKCIRSIIAQTYPDLRVIIVDDGSTDNSGLIADEWARKDRRITVIHQKNQGLSGARNTGILKAETKYIGFVDSDDYIDPEMYEVLINGMKNSDSRIGLCGVWEELENNMKKTRYHPGIEKVFSRDRALVELNSLNYFNMSVWCGCYERMLFFKSEYGDEQVLFPVGKLCEDYYIMHKIIARTERLYYNSNPYYHYVSRKGSITHSKSVVTDSVFAGEERIEFYKRWFPQLAYSAETQYVITLLTVRSQFLSKKTAIPEDLELKFNTDIKRYFSAVLFNKDIKLKRKLLTTVMWVAPGVYLIAKKADRKLFIALKRRKKHFRSMKR